MDLYEDAMYNFDYSSLFASVNDTEVDDNNSAGIEILILRILLCIFGVTANILVIFVVLVLKEYKKTVTHWYVLQLAIADSLFLLTIPFKVVEDKYQKWTFPREMCKTTESVLFLNYFASVFFLMVMSVDRYIAVCHGRSNVFQKLRTRRSAYIITCIVWVTSLIFCIPIFLYSDVRGTDPDCKCYYEFPRNYRESCIKNGFTDEDCIKLEEAKVPCAVANISAFVALLNPDRFKIGFSGDDLPMPVPDRTTSGAVDEEPVIEMGCSYVGEGEGWFHYLNFLFIAMFLIPLLVMSVCYALIIHQLRKTQVRQRASSSDGFNAANGKSRRTLSAAALKTERQFQRVNVVCIVLVLLFVICWLPFHSFHIAMKHGITGSKKYCSDVLLVVSILTYTNSVLNPFVYNCIGTRFGTRLRSAASSVKTSVKQRTASLSSAGGGAVRYKYRHDAGNSSVSGTVVTRLHGKSEMASSMPEQDDCRNSERCALTVKEQFE